MRFCPISAQNEAWVDRIDAGPAARGWVHYNRLWLDRSRAHPDIDARLIVVDAAPEPVGFIAYGQHYADEALREPVSGWYELIQLVIDRPFQRRGYGREATLTAIALLRAMPGCAAIVIAHHPDNHAARALYEALGFQECGRNYDGDPLLRLER